MEHLRNQATRAIDSLQNWRRRNNSGKRKEKTKDGDAIASLPSSNAANFRLLIMLKRPQYHTPLKPFRIAVPHPVNDESLVDVCLFISDKTKELKQEIYDSLPFVKKIIPLANLKLHYHEYEKRRRLLHSYDLFLCESNIVRSLPRLLGKIFFQTNKMPLPVSIAKENFVEEITNAFNSVLLIRSSGVLWDVRFGHTEMKTEENVDNLITVCNFVSESLEKKVDDIQCLSIRIQLTAGNIPPLPIYNSLPSFSTIESGIEEEKKEEPDEEEEIEEIEKEKNPNTMKWRKRKSISKTKPAKKKSKM